MNSYERRIGAGQLEVRKSDDEDRRLVGHAAVFNSLSENLGGFREKIDPGAFANTLDKDIRALWNHNSDIVLGRNRAGTLRLEEDDIGLRIEIDPPDTEQVRGLISSVERGDVSQMSFGFFVRDDSFEEDEAGRIIRTLHDIELLEVSPVAFPAYPDTTVAARSLEQWRSSQGPRKGLIKRRMELAMRERGIAR